MISDVQIIVLVKNLFLLEDCFREKNEVALAGARLKLLHSKVSWQPCRPQQKIALPSD